MGSKTAVTMAELSLGWSGKGSYAAPPGCPTQHKHVGIGVHLDYVRDACHLGTNVRNHFLPPDTPLHRQQVLSALTSKAPHQTVVARASLCGAYGYHEDDGNKEYLQLQEDGTFRYEFGWVQGGQLSTEAYTGKWCFECAPPTFGKVMCRATKTSYRTSNGIHENSSERLLQFETEENVGNVAIISKFHSKQGCRLPKSTCYQTQLYSFGTEIARAP